MAITFTDVIQELALKTEQGKVEWRHTKTQSKFRASLGDFRVTIEADQWGKRDKYIAEVYCPEETLVESARSRDVEGECADLYRKAAQSAIKVDDRRQELWKLLKRLD